MGWIIALGAIILLAVLPLGVSVKYNEDGVAVNLIAGPVKIKLLPKPKGKVKKKPNPKKKSGNSPAAATAKKDKTKKEKKGGSITDFLPLLKTALDFLNDFRRKLRVRRMDAKVILAADDPCDLAVNYGKTWAAVGNVMPYLERFLVIKRRDIQVECDFTASNTLILVHVDLTITLGRIICLLVRYGVRALRQYLLIMKKRKGGATK